MGLFIIPQGLRHDGVLAARGEAFVPQGRFPMRRYVDRAQCPRLVGGRCRWASSPSPARRCHGCSWGGSDAYWGLSGSPRLVESKTPLQLDGLSSPPMCGIAGRAGPAGSWDAADAVAALAHRGPDAADVHTVKVGSWATSVAHTRLAINDLTAAGNQPLFNEDRTLSMVFNGEIYNSPDLRRYCEAKGHVFTSRSDGEVILHLWEDEGRSALRRLNGIFAIAIQDSRDGSIVLARDPIGVKPLFWSTESDTLWFGSEIRALQAAGAPMGRRDPVALAQFLTFLWIPDPRTPHEGARSLPAGHILTWRQGRQRVQAYANLVLESHSEADLTLQVAESEFRGRFEEAVQRQMLSDVPVAVMASGGIDSSLLWWAAKDKLTKAYTIDWSSEAGGEKLHEDTDAVAVLRTALGTPVSFVSGESVDITAVPRSGDLFADPAVELCRQIAEQAQADGHKVLLSGQGGDELLGGYRRHLMGPLAARVPAGPLGRSASNVIARTGNGSVVAEYASRLALSASRRDPLSSYMILCSYSDAADRARVLRVSEREVSDDIVWDTHRTKYEQMPTQWSLLRRFRGVDLSVYLPGLGLAYADRSGMEHSIEIRVPWLDLDLVRWALRLPDAALVRGIRGKILARTLAAEVLPRRISTRSKRGFAAPARLLPGADQHASRGFRQGRYLKQAEEVLTVWLGRQ